MILDVTELRGSGWVPRRLENAPKKIVEIHREIEEERRVKERNLLNRKEFLKEKVYF